MGDFGKSVGYSLGSLFLGQPPRTISTDPRTGYQRAVEARDIATRDALTSEYNRLLNDPSGGMGIDPAGAKVMEQEIVDSVYNRLGAGGSLGSGTSKALASKAIVDYRLGLMNKRNEALARLRQDMMGATPGGTPYAVSGVPGQESFVRKVAGDVVPAAGKAALGGV